MIIPDHTAYLSQLSSQIVTQRDTPQFWEQLSTYTSALSLLTDLSLDPVRDALAALYCPTGQGNPKDPSAMLRSWLLMTLCREGSPTVWARRLTREPVLAILAGFVPEDTPGATTHRDVLTRLLDGPYAVRSKQDVPLSRQLRGRHRRRLEETTTARRAAADAAGRTQSDLLADTLLDQADQPLNPHDLQTRLDHLFVALGLQPTLDAHLLPEALTVSGDGTAEPSAASNNGRRTCTCPPGSRCDCPRDYLSATAQFCHDTQHGWVFGDRSYTISAYVNGHDIPLMTIMGTGNESDFTLSLKALDRLLKLLEDLDTTLTIRIFIGDGHHDAMGIYRYLTAKGIIPIVPLNEDSQPPQGEPSTASTDSPPPDAAPASTGPPVSPRPQIARYPHLTFDPDGTPLCPAGCRMRHHGDNPRKAAHIFACPCQRKNGKQQWVFYDQECPFQQRCTPDTKTMGLTYYIKSKADLRLFPPIPRNSRRFKALYARRSASERHNAVADSYHLDRRHRNAAYLLIRLTFVTIVRHARLREATRHPNGRPGNQLHHALQPLGLAHLMPT